MLPPPPSSTRTHPLFPYTTLFRSPLFPADSARALRSRRRSSRLVRAAVPAPARVLRHAGLCHQGGGARRLRSLRPRPRGVERAVSGVQGKEESAAARWDKRYGAATAPL